MNIYRAALWATVPFTGAACIIIVNLLIPPLAPPVREPAYATERLTCTMLSGNTLACEVVGLASADSQWFAAPVIQPDKVDKSLYSIVADTCRASYDRHAPQIASAGFSPGTYVSDCYSVLNGMAHAESRHRPWLHGDIGNGEAYGIVQINQHFHPGTKTCALDPACAFRFAIERLHRYGYPKLRTRAITCWNSCNNPKYGEDVKLFAQMYK